MSQVLHTKLVTPHDIGVELGARLKNVRRSKSMPQSELAERAGISRKTLIVLERHGEGSLATFIRVASILGQSDVFNTMFLLKPNSIADLEKQERLATRKTRNRQKTTITGVST